MSAPRAATVRVTAPLHVSEGIMKRLTIATMIATIATFAAADTYEIPNKSGGKIVLEEYVCIGKGGKRYEKLKSMFTVSPSGRRISGCWYYSDGYVHVMYSDGTEYTYPANEFRTIKDNSL